MFLRRTPELLSLPRVGTGRDFPGECDGEQGDGLGLGVADVCGGAPGPGCGGVGVGDQGHWDGLPAAGLWSLVEGPDNEGPQQHGGDPEQEWSGEGYLVGGHGFRSVLGDRR